MSQMRKDVFTGRWVIMAETDTVRPTDFQFRPFTRGDGFCPFCETNESSTPPEVFAIRRSGSLPNEPGWQVRVVPNNRPRLRIEGDLGRRGEGFHDLMNGIGAHEIIAETPRHDRVTTADAIRKAAISRARAHNIAVPATPPQNTRKQNKLVRMGWVPMSLCTNLGVGRCGTTKLFRAAHRHSVRNQNNHMTASRVGLSFDASGDDKTAIRAGVGQFGHRLAGTITGPVRACTRE